MWIRKGERDRMMGVDSPIPTQVVSNEEFIPRPQTEKQKQVESLIMEWGTRNAKKIGMSRRGYMASSMGLATAFLASNCVYGQDAFEVGEDEQFEPRETETVKANGQKGKFFVIDVQAHYSNGIALSFRNSETARNMGFSLKDDVESYSFRTFTKEMFLDSETAMVVISGVPGKEEQRAPDGRVLVDAERTPRGAILPSWLMAKSRNELNAMAGSQRALCQGNLAPNHYWNTATNSIDKAATLEQMERELNVYKINSWKWYCHTDPARTGNGFQLDDDNAQWFIEESRKRGMKLLSVHKGYSGLEGDERVQSGDGRLPVAQGADGYQTEEPADQQRLSGGGIVLQHAGDPGPCHGDAWHGAQHQDLWRGPCGVGDRLPVVGITAMGDRRVQAVPDFGRALREAWLCQDN